jgi:hypothetical protein
VSTAGRGGVQTLTPEQRAEIRARVATLPKRTEAQRVSLPLRRRGPTRPNMTARPHEIGSDEWLWSVVRNAARKSPTRLLTCPGCGRPIYRESKVVVYGYTQQFLINPKVQVFWNGELVGSVKKGDSLSFDIDRDGRVSFSASVRKASLRVKAGRLTNIKISWDRITGKMIPQIVDVVTPGA